MHDNVASSEDLLLGDLRSKTLVRTTPDLSTCDGGMVMLTLYGSARSRGVRNLWLIDERGLDFEHEGIAPRSQPTKTAEFRATSVDISRWSKVDSWLQRCWSRPAAKRALAMREA